MIFIFIELIFFSGGGTYPGACVWRFEDNWAEIIFSRFHQWDPRIKLWSSGVVLCAFNHGATSLPLVL